MGDITPSKFEALEHLRGIGSTFRVQGSKVIIT